MQDYRIAFWSRHLIVIWLFLAPVVVLGAIRLGKCSYTTGVNAFVTVSFIGGALVYLVTNYQTPSIDSKESATR